MILVTGATGILGRMIVLELLKQNQSVRACYHHAHKCESLQKSFEFYLGDAHLAATYYQKIQWHHTDFSNFDSINEALEGVSEIYHCAAMVSFNAKDEQALMRVNVEFTKNLLYVAQEQNIAKFCYISSVATLDKLNDALKIDESSDWDSKTTHSHYAMSKFLAEMEVFRAHAEGLNTLIINPSVIIGAGHGQQSSSGLLAFHQKYAYYLPGETGFVDVRDVAQITLKLMAQNAFGERFIVSAEQKTYAWLANCIRQKSGLKPPKALANWQIYALRFFAFLLSPFSKKMALLNKHSLGPNNKIKPYLNHKVVAHTQHQFIDLAQSIDQHLIYYNQHQK